jgi:hypothetical protein
MRHLEESIALVASFERQMDLIVRNVTTRVEDSAAHGGTK